MKVYSYGCRPFDELLVFNNYAKEFDIDIGCTKEPLHLDNVHLAEGADYVSVLTNPVSSLVLDKLKSMGVRMLGTRTVGYDHIDCEHAKRIGLKISNSAYSPDAVAEFTIMLMLMSLRKMKSIIDRSSINDFSLKGLRGNNLSGRKVGVIGTGSIGQRVIELLRGFGCEIYAYNPSPVSIEGVEFLPMQELFQRCDLFTLHAPLRDETRRIINRDNIKLMPKGSVLINTSRGGLVDSDALIEALQSGKISACGFDVIEGEEDLFYYNRKNEVIYKPHLSILRDMPNVIISPHIAFYTSVSVDDMVRNNLQAFINDYRNAENPFRVI